MDGTRFDDLVKRLALARLTRSAAVRGMAGGALAGLTGAVIADDEAEAKKKGRKRGAGNKGATVEKKKKKKKLCHCPDGNPANCVTIKVKKKARKKHLRNHPFDTKGECPAVTTTTPAVTTTTATATTTTVEVTTTTAASTTTTGAGTTTTGP